MGRNDGLNIRFSRGSGQNFGKVENKALPWSKLIKGFSTPTRTQELFRMYLKMSDKEQVRLKSVDGFFYRTQVEGKTRNRSSGRPSDMITLDFDAATPEFLEGLMDGSICGDVEWFFHTTRRHTPEKPRVRILIPTDSPITNDMYGAVSRIVALLFDPDFSMIDKVSFRPAQMMFLPTCSSDSEFLTHRNEGKLIPWQTQLDIFEMTRGDWRDVAELPKCPGEELRHIAEKAEVPTEKDGPVGDFCRAYDIFEAIEKFLPDVYTPTDDHSGKPRYTYLGGTTTNGAEVQDDGLFLYSHHGSDPCSDMLVNSFDLVRIHKFGNLDTHEDHEKGMAQWPSFKNMMEFIKEDEGFARQVIASRYDMTAMFTDADVAGGDIDDAEIVPDDDEEDLIGARVPSSRELVVFKGNELQEDDDEEDLIGEPLAPLDYVSHKPGTRWPRPAKDWHLGLERTKDGDIMSSSHNITTIVQTDVRVNESIEYNAFTQEIVCRIPLKTRLSVVPTLPVQDKANGDLWGDHHSRALRVMLEAENGQGKLGWGLRVSDRDVDLAVDMTARQNHFHPIKDMLVREEWDGRKRLESILVRYLGTDNHAYFREIARLFFVAAVARVFEPGHKFDFVIILEGEQGLRKSTFIKTLAMGYFGEMTADMHDEKAMVENMSGCLILELPELSSIKRSEVETVKATISRTTSIVRLAYARRAQTFHRQCVFMGTTNEHDYLVDRTGNRRWWPCKVEVEEIDTDALESEMPQVWAEALHEYRRMRAVQPHGDLRLFLADPELKAYAESLQEGRVQEDEADGMAGTIEEWLMQPLSSSKFDDSEKEYRDQACVKQIWTEVLGNARPATRMDVVHVAKALRRIGWDSDGKSRRMPGYGVTKIFTPVDRKGNQKTPEWWLETRLGNDESDENLI